MKFKKEKTKKPKDGLLDSVREEIDALDEAGLNKCVATAEQAITTAKAELSANEHFVAAKEKVKDLSSGLKDVRKYQGAKISYALKRIQVIKGDLEASELDN